MRGSGEDLGRGNLFELASPLYKHLHVLNPLLGLAITIHRARLSRGRRLTKRFVEDDLPPARHGLVQLGGEGILQRGRAWATGRPHARGCGRSVGGGPELAAPILHEL